MKTWKLFAAALLWGAASGLDHQASASPPAGIDADTRAWWTMTEVLADDGMEGRDTGSAGYARAAEFVVRQFESAGLTPAGDHGGWLQRVPLTEVQVEPEGTSVTVVRDHAENVRFEFLHEITVRAADGMPSDLNAPLAFRGYCSPQELGSDTKGKIAVCFGTRRQGLPSAAERISAAAAAGASGLISVDD